MKKLYIVVVVCFILYGCDADDQCTPAVIGISNLEIEHGCENTKFELDIDISNDYRIIHSQDDFLNLVQGSCMPQIDFNKYDLVIGKKTIAKINNSIVYSMIRNCDDEKLYLEVIFNQSETITNQELTYHALIPKLSQDGMLIVTVILN